MPSNPRLVLIEWLDSRQPMGAWQFLRDLVDADPCHCASVGFQVFEGNGVKVIVLNLANVQDSESIQVSGCITIPECSIQRVTDLTQPVTRGLERPT